MRRAIVFILRATTLVPLMLSSVCVAAALDDRHVRFGDDVVGSPRWQLWATCDAWDLRMRVERLELDARPFQDEFGGVRQVGAWRSVYQFSLWPWFIGALAFAVFGLTVDRYRPLAEPPGGFPVELNGERGPTL